MSVRVMPIGRASRRLSVALTTALAALLVLSAPSALAVTSTSTYVPGDFFGVQGARRRGVPVAGKHRRRAGRPTMSSSPTPLNARVQVLEPSGNGVQYLTSFGTGTLTAPFGLAIDQTSGAVYVTDTDAGNPVIRRYTSDGAATPTYTLDTGFTSPAIVSARSTLAVDPTTHDLVVADTGTQEIKRFAVGDGHLISSFNGSTSAAVRSPRCEASRWRRRGRCTWWTSPIRTRSSSIPVPGGSSGSTPRARRRARSRAWIRQSAVAVDGAGSACVALEQRLLPASAPAVAVLRLGSCELDRQLPGIGRTGGVVGLAYDEHQPARRLRAVRPGVRSVRQARRSALHAGRDPGCGDRSGELGGRDDGAGDGLRCARGCVGRCHHPLRVLVRRVDPTEVTPDQPVVAGPGETAVSEDLTGLRPNTTYSVRLIAANDDFSAATLSAVRTFTTGAVAPGVQDGGVTDRTASTVVVNGRVNPLRPADHVSLRVRRDRRVRERRAGRQ